jgi:histidine triad (HIT) family protein
MLACVHASPYLLAFRMADKTLFQKIMDRELDADIVYEDDACIAFRDINPQAPTHLLIVPRKPIPSLFEMEEDDEPVVGHLFTVARHLAEEEGLDGGFRTVFNCGDDAQQSVYHLHLHLLGGRELQWPPG